MSDETKNAKLLITVILFMVVTYILEASIFGGDIMSQIPTAFFGQPSSANLVLSAVIGFLNFLFMSLSFIFSVLTFDVGHIPDGVRWVIVIIQLVLYTLIVFTFWDKFVKLADLILKGIDIIVPDWL